MSSKSNVLKSNNKLNTNSVNKLPPTITEMKTLLSSPQTSALTKFRYSMSVAALESSDDRKVSYEELIKDHKIPTYRSINRSVVPEIADVIKKLKLKESISYLELVYLIENEMNIRITNIDTQTCRSNITRAVTKAVDKSIGGAKTGYYFL